ncbi:MAG: 50S ribosomal protein L33 [Candidatus Margulisiibacteriota bacterium]
MQDIITLSCEVCKRKNHTTSKNKKNIKERLQLLKFCPWCKKQTKHKEEK